MNVSLFQHHKGGTTWLIIPWEIKIFWRRTITQNIRIIIMYGINVIYIKRTKEKSSKNCLTFFFLELWWHRCCPLKSFDWWFMRKSMTCVWWAGSFTVFLKNAEILYTTTSTDNTLNLDPISTKWESIIDNKYIIVVLVLFMESKICPYHISSKLLKPFCLLFQPKKTHVRIFNHKF